MILCLGIYLYANNLRYQLIPSKNIIYNRILQSDWTKGTTGYTQLKAVSDANFPLMIISMKKIEDINIFPPEMLLIKES